VNLKSSLESKSVPRYDGDSYSNILENMPLE
jgi:hypothetical protein